LVVLEADFQIQVPISHFPLLSYALPMMYFLRFSSRCVMIQQIQKSQH
jgi:hypothetical protein